MNSGSRSRNIGNTASSITGIRFIQHASIQQKHDMAHLNSGYLQLGLFALAFGGLQVWWISSTLRKRTLARPMSEGEFRRSLERIWAKRST